MEKEQSRIQGIHTVKQIIVAQRGWVFAGDVQRKDNQVIIYNAENIRRWGTSNGLGQLAIEGKQENTKTDPYGTVEIHELAVVAAITIQAEWK